METHGGHPPGIGEDGQMDMGPLSLQSASSGSARGWVQSRGMATLSVNFSHGSVARETLADQVDRDEANMLDKIWPGFHNVLQLTHFVASHFAGD